MKNKTRVALCLSGEPRSSMFCFPYIYESLINLGSEYEVDVYIHSWKNFRALPLYKPKNYLIEWVNERDFFNKIIKSLKFEKSPNATNIIKELNFHTDNSNPLKNYFLMYLSMKQCFNLIDTSYDIYIRGRLDFYISYPLNLIPILEEIKLKSYDVFLPSIDINNQIFFNDQFAVCNLKGAKYYFNLFNEIPSLIEETGMVNPHIWLKNYLKNSKLNVKNSSFLIDLVRSSRVITACNHPYYDN